MLTRLKLAVAFVIATCATSAQAVYFPAGIDWANPAHNRFIESLYLNALGRPPQSSEMSTASRFLRRSDTSQSRLDLFKQLITGNEYTNTFGRKGNQWQVFRAPDLNYGSGSWRYQAAQRAPDGFQRWHLSGTSSESVAEAMASYYETYCFNGSPCIAEPQAAYKRGRFSTSQINTPSAHACADESKQISEFQWIGINGTTYPRGTDTTTVCMGQHYYKADGVLLQRYQCEAGYINCQRDSSRDIRGQRTAIDSNGNPTLYFSDGSRLVLTNYSEALRQTGDLSVATNQPAAQQHGCANPARTTSRFRWKGASGISNSAGIGNSVVCMDNFFYVIDGKTLRHYDCESNFSNCRANTSKDITATKRRRIDGHPGLEFRNGTTLALVRKGSDTGNILPESPTVESQSIDTAGTPIQSSQVLKPGQHHCADSTMRVSQFRWTKADGSSSWPDGVAGRFVCLRDSYYEIQGATLRHHTCSDNFINCRTNRRNDLIAVSDSTDGNGYRTLTFANGDKLSLISR